MVKWYCMSLAVGASGVRGVHRAVSTARTAQYLINVRTTRCIEVANS